MPGWAVRENNSYGSLRGLDLVVHARIEVAFTLGRRSAPIQPMGKSRLEAFSDGVIAIIITIMVLELKAPHEASLDALRPLMRHTGSAAGSCGPIFICFSGSR
jgi:hypothetical protein